MIEEETLSFLTKAGWTPKREIDVTEIVAELKKDGYPVFPAAVEFLKRFGLLDIVFPKRVAHHDDHLRTDPRITINTCYIKAVLRYYPQHLQTDLCALGQCFNGYMNLLVTPENKFYLSGDDVLVFLGNNEIEALNDICVFQRWENVHLDPKMIAEWNAKV